MFVTVGALIVLVLFTALIAPLLIDWSAYKKDFEREASLVAGHPVQVGGNVSLRILPLPAVSFEDLVIGQNRDGTPLMTVERFSLNAELMPFLSGEVRIVDMTMLQPRVNLKVEENGTVAWTNRQEGQVNPEKIKLDKLTVNNGSIKIDGLAGGRSISLENIQANLSASSLLGPWRINADTLLDGKQANFRISTGGVQDSGAVRVRVEATRVDQPYKLTADGPIRLDDKVLNWSGEFGLAPLSGDEVAGRGSPLPVDIDGKFEATPEVVRISEYHMQVGNREDPYTITGKGAVTLGENLVFKMTADGRQVDLDRIAAKASEEKAQSVSDRIEAMRSVFERIPVPAIDGEIDILLPAVVTGDTVIREIKSRAKPIGEGWELKSLSAILPGNTFVEANGYLGLKADFGFAGDMTIASRQPTGFASWVSGEVHPAFRKLKTAGVSARVSLSPAQILLDEMELVLGDAIINGSLQRLMPDDGPTAILAKLRGERIVLDDLQAIYSLARQNGNDGGLHTDFDVEITSNELVGVLAGQKFVASDIDTHLQVRAGAVSIERLNASDFFGAKIKSSGRIENVLSSPNGNMKLQVSANDAQGLLSLASRYLDDVPAIEHLRSGAELTQNTQLDIELDTTSENQDSRGLILANGSVGGTKIDLRAGFEGAFDQLSETDLNINAKLENSVPNKILRQAGLDALPVEVPGPVTVNLNFSGIPKNGLATQIAINAPDTNFTADGTARSVDGRELSANLELTLGSNDFAPMLLVTGIQLPGIGYDTKLPVSVTLNFEHLEGVTSLEAISGQVAGNRFSGELMVKPDELGRIISSGSFDVDHLSLPLITSGLFGLSPFQMAFEDSGAQIWSTNEFGSPLFGQVDAQIDLSGKTGNLGGNLTASNVTGKMEIANGAVNLRGFELDAFGGKIESTLELKNIEGTVSANLQYQLHDARLQSIGRAAGMPDLLNGRLSASGTAQTTGKSIAAMISGSSGSGVVKLEDGRITGLNPKGLPGLLARSDEEEFEISPETVNLLVVENILNNQFSTGSLENTYTQSQGRVIVRNIRVDHEGSSLIGEVEIDVGQGSVESIAAMRFDPGKEAIVGADPEVEFSWSGKLTRPTRRMDTSQLEGFLSLRAFERSQRRIETMEANVLETQRLRRELQLARLKELYRERKEEEARRLLEEKLKREREAEEARKKEEERLAEEARKAEEARIIEEERLAEEARKAEEARIKEEERLAEEARKAEETRINEEETQDAQEALQAEEVENTEEPLQAEEPLQTEEPLQAEEAEGSEETFEIRENSVQELEQGAVKFETELMDESLLDEIKRQLEQSSSDISIPEQQAETIPVIEETPTPKPVQLPEPKEDTTINQPSSAK